MGLSQIGFARLGRTDGWAILHPDPRRARDFLLLSVFRRGFAGFGAEDSYF